MITYLLIIYVKWKLNGFYVLDTCSVGRDFTANRVKKSELMHLSPCCNWRCIRFLRFLRFFAVVWIRVVPFIVDHQVQ